MNGNSLLNGSFRLRVTRFACTLRWPSGAHRGVSHYNVLPHVCTRHKNKYWIIVGCAISDRLHSASPSRVLDEWRFARAGRMQRAQLVIEDTEKLQNHIPTLVNLRTNLIRRGLHYANVVLCYLRGYSSLKLQNKLISLFLLIFGVSKINC